jgi:hypothetical protein
MLRVFKIPGIDALYSPHGSFLVCPELIASFIKGKEQLIK